MHRHSKHVALAILLVAGLAPLAASPQRAVAAIGADEFNLVPLVGGLNRPTAVRFTPDGKVIVAEQSGLIKWFRSVNDPTPHTLIDLRDQVYDYGDRGLIGMEIEHLDWAAEPSIWVLYTKNALPGGSAPYWPPQQPRSNGTYASPGHLGADDCPTPPGKPEGDPFILIDGCVATGTLARIKLDPDTLAVQQVVPMIDGEWCQQFPSHSVGGLLEGSDGALYVGAGDGGSWSSQLPDYGQHGGSQSNSVTPRNPCDDPGIPATGTVDPAVAEGGSLRSQDLRTPDDPVGYDGSVLRVDRAFGRPLGANPLIGGRTDDDRTVAIGLRNPWRLVERPGSGEIWVSEVGWQSFEEMDVIKLRPTTVTNFGWPCYEGPVHQFRWEQLNTPICNDLYASGDETPPVYTYLHHSLTQDCPSAATVISGLAFSVSNYGADYANSVFFSDAWAGCIWSMKLVHRDLNDATSPMVPDPASILTIGHAGASDIQPGPGGNLYVLDVYSGALMRLDRTSVVCPAGDQFEPNNTAATAATLGGVDTHAALCADDDDWYRIDATEGQQLGVQVTSPGSAFVPTVSVQDPAGHAVTVPSTVSLSGAYLVHVSAGDQQQHAYRIRAWTCTNDHLINTTAHPATIAGQSAVQCPDEAEVYTSFHRAGDTSRITLSFPGGSGPVALPDAAPGQLGRGSTNTTTWFDYKFTDTGYATFSLVPGATVTPRPYTIEESPLPGDQPCFDAWSANHTVNSAADPHGHFPISGMVCPGETDFYRVHLPANHQFIALERGESGAPVSIRLVDGNGGTVVTGTELTSTTHGAYQRLSFTLPVDADAVIAVTALTPSPPLPRGNGVGYTLNVLPSSLGHDVAPDQTVGAIGNGPEFPISLQATTGSGDVTHAVSVAVDESDDAVGRLPVSATVSTSPLLSKMTTDIQIDKTVVPGGANAQTIQVLLDGSVVRSCINLNADPCLNQRFDTFDGPRYSVRSTHGGVLTFVVDRTPPVVTTDLAEGSTFIVNEPVTPNFECNDAGVGVAYCATNLGEGGALDTSRSGPHSLVISAMDNAGNSTTTTVNYTVTYRFRGFVAPLTQDAYASVLANRGLPLNYFLTDFNGTDVSTSDNFVSLSDDPIPCPTDVPKNVITADAKPGLRRYHTTGWQYGYVVPSADLLTCRVLSVHLDDGTEHTTKVFVAGATNVPSSPLLSVVALLKGLVKTLVGLLPLGLPQRPPGTVIGRR